MPLYAPIDWKKVAAMFQSTPLLQQNGKKFPSRRELLGMLARAGELGLLYLFNADKAGIESVLLGQRPYVRWQIMQVTKQLEKQKYVTVKGKGDTVTVTITKQGMRRALTYQLGKMKLLTPKKWDGKWRVIIFDIPESYHHTRDIFRMRIRQLGLYFLQESVFVSPYPCFNEVEFLRELYGVAFTVRYLLVEKIEEDRPLRDHFHLA